MIWAIVILALMNISTIITIVFHRHNQTENNLPMISGQAQSENASLQFSGRYFRDQLNLTRDQMTSFRQFNTEFRTGVRNINISLTEKRHQMLKEMAGETSDNARLDALSDSIGILHAELKKLTYRYYMDFKKFAINNNSKNWNCCSKCLAQISRPDDMDREAYGRLWKRNN